MVLPGMKSVISQILETCPICTMNNPNTRPFRGPQIEPIQIRRTYLGEDWQTDFTVMTRYEKISLLILGDTFAGCIEAFPARIEMEYEVLQFSSVTQSCPTLCDPMNHSTPGLPVPHQLPESTQTHVHRVDDAIQPSHPLSSPSPSLNLSQHQGLSQ